MSPITVAIAGFFLTVAFCSGFVCGALWVAGSGLTTDADDCWCDDCEQDKPTQGEQ